MKLIFELSMPNVGSWNGKWTGEEDYHAKVIDFGQRYGNSEQSRERLAKVLENESYYYNFGDGWGMSISVRVAKPRESQKVRKKSKGFCGYDWAIESILEKQKITC